MCECVYVCVCMCECMFMCGGSYHLKCTDRKLSKQLAVKYLMIRNKHSSLYKISSLIAYCNHRVYGYLGCYKN